MELIMTGNNDNVRNFVNKMSQPIAPQDLLPFEPLWHATRHQAETAVQMVGTAEASAWYPVVLDQLTICMTGRTWAGAKGGHVYLLTLEGIE